MPTEGKDLEIHMTWSILKRQADICTRTEFIFKNLQEFKNPDTKS